MTLFDSYFYDGVSAGMGHTYRCKICGELVTFFDSQCDDCVNAVVVVANRLCK